MQTAVCHILQSFSRTKEDPRACLCPKLKVIFVGDLSFDGSGDFGLALGTRVKVTPLSEVRKNVVHRHSLEGNKIFPHFHDVSDFRYCSSDI